MRDIPLSESLEIAPSVESFIFDEFGGGHWAIEILDTNNVVIASYKADIAGTLYNPRTGKKAHPDDPWLDPDYGTRRKSKGTDIDQFLETMMKFQQLTAINGPSRLEEMLIEGGSRTVAGLVEEPVTRTPPHLERIVPNLGNTLKTEPFAE